MTATLQRYKRVYERLGAIIASLPIDEKSFNIDSLASFLRGSNIIMDADLSEGSVSTLINSSAFEIISNSELRTLLVQWKDLVADYQRAEAMAIKFATEQFLPYMDEHIPMNYHKGIKDIRTDLSFLSSVKF